MKSPVAAPVLTFLMISTIAAGHADAAPRVVVSIKPVHSLVAGVMDGIGAPTLLIKGGASPHSYAMKPSDARALRDADLVFWIGGTLETFLSKTLGARPRKNEAVELSKAAGVKVLRARDTGDATGHAGRGHAHDAGNMHLWLDPANAMAITAAVARALVRADPENAARYRTNADKVRSRLGALDANLRVALAAVRTVPYIVFHDAYPYFENRYGLNNIGAITVSPEARPGAKRVYEMRKKLQSTGAVCAFAEPQFEPALVNTIVRGSKTRIGVLDPLGAGIEPDKDAYFILMKKLSESFRRCLLRPVEPTR